MSYGWFRVSHALGIPVAELRARITWTEFLGWLVYLDQAETRRTKQDYYLAQIAAEVRRGLVKKPNTVKLDSFLFEVPKDKEMTEPSNKQRVQASKRAWLGALGMTAKKRK